MIRTMICTIYAVEDFVPYLQNNIDRKIKQMLNSPIHFKQEPWFVDTDLQYAVDGELTDELSSRNPGCLAETARWRNDKGEIVESEMEKVVDTLQHVPYVVSPKFAELPPQVKMTKGMAKGAAAGEPWHKHAIPSSSFYTLAINEP